MSKELDYMEYSSDALAQAAYVTNGGYTSNIITGGTASADTEQVGYEASKACDGNTGTSWASTDSAFPHYWKYAFASAKRITKLTIKAENQDGHAAIKAFTLQGSINDSDYDVIYTGQQADNYDVQTFTFSNSTAYQYYKIVITTIWGSNNTTQISEIGMMETALQSYSESTIKTQGSYALKAVAAITDSLNKTLTKTFSPAKDLSGVSRIRFDIRSSRTGSNIKIGLHDSGGTTTEITPNITSAGEFQTVEWDISAVADADKNAIDSVIVTILNADAVNTFYIDNFRGLDDNTKTFTDDTFSLSDSMPRSLSRSISDVMAISELSLSKGVGKNFTDSFSLSDLILRGITVIYSEALTLTEVAARNIYLVITETVGLADNIVKGFGKFFTDTYSLSDIGSRVLKWLRQTRVATAWNRAGKILTTWAKDVRSQTVWRRKNE